MTEKEFLRQAPRCLTEEPDEKGLIITCGYIRTTNGVPEYIAYYKDGDNLIRYLCKSNGVVTHRKTKMRRMMTDMLDSGIEDNCDIFYADERAPAAYVRTRAT